MQLQIKTLAAAIPVITYFLPIDSNAFTYPLVHGNIFHLAANVITLFMFIRASADTKTFVNFIIGGYVASVLAYVLYGNTLTVGASGFVFGIIGIYTVFNYRGMYFRLLTSSFIWIVLAYIVVGFIIPGLAGWLHLYAFGIGIVYGSVALRVNRFIRKLQYEM